MPCSSASWAAGPGSSLDKLAGPAGTSVGQQLPRAPLLAPGHLVPLFPFVCLGGREGGKGEEPDFSGQLSSELGRNELAWSGGGRRGRREQRETEA